MGINGQVWKCIAHLLDTNILGRIYHEIGPGERIALSKLAVETYEQKGRPLRLAIDISIWLFQIQASEGKRNLEESYDRS